MKCNSCGGEITVRDQTCKYCGAANGSYEAPVVHRSTYTAPTQSTSTQYVNTPAATPKKPFRWGIFILLLIFTGPVAFVYPIARMLGADI